MRITAIFIGAGHPWTQRPAPDGSYEIYTPGGEIRGTINKGFGLKCTLAPGPQQPDRITITEVEFVEWKDGRWQVRKAQSQQEAALK